MINRQYFTLAPIWWNFDVATLIPSTYWETVRSIEKFSTIKANVIISCFIFIFRFSSDLVDGNYGDWTLNSTCNVTCGEGFETWTRNCNNPEPLFGGANCSHLGEPVQYKSCVVKTCPGR